MVFKKHKTNSTRVIGIVFSNKSGGVWRETPTRLLELYEGEMLIIVVEMGVTYTPIMSLGAQGNIGIAMREAERIDTEMTYLGMIDVGEIATRIDAERTDTGIMIVIVVGGTAVSTKFDSPPM